MLIKIAKSKNKKPVIPLPALSQHEYLHHLMIEIGPIRANGMGVSPTDWNVLVPFAEFKGLDVTDTETLWEMFLAYHQEFQAGADPLRIPPMDRAEMND